MANKKFNFGEIVYLSNNCPKKFNKYKDLKFTIRSYYSFEKKYTLISETGKIISTRSKNITKELPRVRKIKTYLNEINK